jgi:choline dehydrogenase-like flavoprotein
MMSYSNKVIDAENIIIGSGAGGSTVFEQLASAGKDVILLEEGDWITNQDKSNSISLRIQKFYRNAGLYPVVGIPSIAYGEGVAVGGSTEINGGLFWPPPKEVLNIWRKGGLFSEYSEEELTAQFAAIEKDLNVVSEQETQFDIPSKLLSSGGLRFDLSPIPARRAVKGCLKRNECAAGCLSGAKQSMSMTYIPKGLSLGGRLYTNNKVISIKHSLNGYIVLTKNPISKKFSQYQSKNIFLAGGALNSPSLLSTYLNKPIHTQLGLHLNLKIIVRFNRATNPELGTIFTHQIQDYLEEGLLFMASNFKPEFLGIAISSASKKTRLEIIDSYQNLALYTVQIRPSNFGNLYTWKNFKLPLYNLSLIDYKKIKLGIRKICELLFVSGAEKVWLPFGNLYSASNLDDVDLALEICKSRDLQLSSVHAMSTLPVASNTRNFFDNYGRFKMDHSLKIADASGLPSLVGESPQGAIMLFAKHVARSIDVKN